MVAAETELIGDDFKMIRRVAGSRVEEAEQVVEGGGHCVVVVRCLK
jgi:hypothetical protein